MRDLLIYILRLGNGLVRSGKIFAEHLSHFDYFSAWLLDRTFFVSSDCWPDPSVDGGGGGQPVNNRLPFDVGNT